MELPNSLAMFITDARVLTVIEIWIKAAIVFALAGTAVMLLRQRASAALRHWIWLLAIAVSLTLPFVSLFVSGWTIPVSVSRSEGTYPREAETEPLRLAELGSFGVASEAAAIEIPTNAAGAITEASIAAAEQPGAAITESAPARSIDWGTVVIAVYAAGFLLSLLPVGLGALSLRRLARTCQRVSDDRRLSTFKDLRQRLSLHRAISLIESDRRAIPMTWGLAHPVVLLPKESIRWPSERLRAALLHELAHVRRFDCLTQVVAQLARAVYWANPLAWLAVRGLRQEQERACDDCVLQAGMPASDYAGHLLSIAQSRCGQWTPAVALAMARSRRIESRLKSILDKTSNHRSLSRRQTVAAAVVTFGLLAPLACVSAQVEEAQAADQATAKEDSKGETKSETPATSERLTQLREILAEQYVTRPNDEQVIRGAIQGMVQSLGDPYSEFLTSEKLAELETHIGGKLTGIGAQLEMRQEQLTVVTPLEGSPAFKAGVKAGDAILEINGEPTGELKIADAVKRIVGEAGSEVKLKLRRASGEIADVTVVRGPIVLRSIRGFQRGKDHRWQWLLSSEYKIGYIGVDHLASGTPKEISEAIDELKKNGLAGLILDLRFSPGGLLQSAHETAELFISEGTVVTIRGRNGEEQVFKSDGKKRLGDFPMVVLINEHTASATEILAGALKDNGRGMMVGTRTFGKGSVQSLVKLADGSGALRLTTAFYHVPSGRNIDRRPGERDWGVDPTDGFFIPLSAEQTEQLQRRRREREIIAGDDSADRAAARELTAEAIAKEHADPQLAAALRTMITKITFGEFEKVGKSAEAAQQYAVRRDEINRRREGLLKNIQELDRELSSFEKETK
jgi:carboxyl-terminal processing protease